MGLESGNFISDLVQTNPLGADPKAAGDDHLRLIKKVLQQTLLNGDKAYDLQAMEIAGILNSDKSNRNLVVNGDQSITQRGTAIAGLVDGEYYCDRFLIGVSGSTCDYERIIDINAGEIAGAKLTPGAGNTLLNVRHRIEAASAGKNQNVQMTLSIRLRTSIAHNVTLKAFTADSFEDFSSVTERGTSGLLTTANNNWEWKTFTAAITSADILNGVEVRAEFGASDGVVIEYGSVQYEVGQERTRFEYQSQQQLIDDCERFYQLIEINQGAGLGQISMGQCNTTTGAFGPLLYARKRAAPVITVPVGGLDVLSAGGSLAGASTVAFTSLEKDRCGWLATGAAGLVIGNASALTNTANPTWIRIDAEL